MSFDKSKSAVDLSDIGVLVTRAAHQAGSLSASIAAHGGRPMRFPAVEICRPADLDLVRRQLAEAGKYDFSVFISQNAVMYAIKLSPDEKLVAGPAIVAVGRGTAQKLAESGYPVDVVPDHRFDTEALLETPELTEIRGKRVMIVRGNGGRELLSKELTQRGAIVDYVEAYVRNCPEVDVTGLLQQWRDDIDIVTVTSIDLLDNLFCLLGEEGDELLKTTPLVVVSDRMRQNARERGCANVILAKGAEDLLITEAVAMWAHCRS